MQKILFALWVKNFTFSILSSVKLNFSWTVFGTTWLCTIVFRADTGNNRKIVYFTYSSLCARSMKVVSVDKYNKKQSLEKFLKSKILEIGKHLISNLENVNMLSSPNFSLRNGVASKKRTCITKVTQIS